ncbi:hypothetical protein A500_16470 [Clostridium sartagoforme AAU1]|uniref:Uncharacterized protein n=1 Tax=Clostridium sartagoforme AAU1 TaxID=1202534 RepID=R9BV05_9CLOT|nr:hypothetical protein [Clostridium sartagoforme]EOR20550.1 hypothetical protein A500_16470 [Clostridium sartagoforme AAU1]
MKYLDFKGCGACKLNESCKEYKKNVNITFDKSEKADNWGRIVTVFSKGETVRGEAVIKDDKIYCASAQSNIYEGYEDFIGLNHVTIEVLE